MVVRVLRQIVRDFNIHLHSRYCRVRSRKRRYRFNYDNMTITPQTYFDQTCNGVIYGRRHHEHLNIVPYNADLTINNLAHINVKRTQEVGAVVYLMKDAFKPPNPVDLRVETREERGPSSRNVARENISNYIRLYIKTRVMGSVEAA